jgi:hypothetical protein
MVRQRIGNILLPHPCLGGTPIRKVPTFVMGKGCEVGGGGPAATFVDLRIETAQDHDVATSEKRRERDGRMS